MPYLIPSEDDECIAFAEYLTVNRYTFTHIPNGGSRNVIEATKLKRMGVSSGVPDYLVIVKGQLVWIEMKKSIYKNRKQGGLSDSQVAWHDALNACANSEVFVCYSADEARRIIMSLNSLNKFIAPATRKTL